MDTQKPTVTIVDTRQLRARSPAIREPSATQWPVNNKLPTITTSVTSPQDGQTSPPIATVSTSTSKTTSKSASSRRVPPAKNLPAVSSGSKQQKQMTTKKIDRARRTVKMTTRELEVSDDRFPLCLVWTPLPMITWLVPVIGHTGISNSRGIIYDFSADYQVAMDKLGYGTPTKYYQFDLALMRDPQHVGSSLAAWDKAIEETCELYKKLRHSLVSNNCHQFVAHVLNKTHYDNRSDWSQMEVWWLITRQSEYVNIWGAIRQWLPFVLFITMFIIFCSWLSKL